MKNKKNLIYILLCVFLLFDLGYSYHQYSQSQIDGDFATIVLGGPPYDQVLADPLGISALEGNKYPGTNRYVAYAFMSTYFKNVPFILQLVMSPLESIYTSIATTKLLIHIALLFLLSYYVSAWRGFTWKSFLVASLLITPFFHAGPIYYEYFAIIDPTITYTMFYALPMVFVLTYFLPFYHYFITDKISRNPLFLAGWGFFTLILVLFGPLPAPIILIFSFCTLGFLAVKNFFQTWHVDPTKRFLKALQKIDSTLLFFIVLTILLSVYSIYIGKNNSENFWSPLPIEQRYDLLIKGIFEVFLNFKNGWLLFLTATIINVTLLYIFYRKRERKYFKLLFFLLAFCLIFILLLPLGGYRSYRPFIIRRDTILPFLILFLLIWASSGILLISYIKKSTYKSIYITSVVALCIFYTLKDEAPQNGNTCEKETILAIANSNENCVVLPRKCSVASWGFYERCSQNERASALFKYYNVFPRKIYYRFEEAITINK